MPTIACISFLLDSLLELPDIDFQKKGSLLTKDLLHHLHQFQHLRVGDGIVDHVAVPTRGNQALFPHLGQVLGKVRLRGAQLLRKVLYVHFTLGQEGHDG